LPGRGYDVAMRYAMIALVGLLVACDKPHPNCEKAVKHVFHLTVYPVEGAPKPGRDEQAVIDQIASKALDSCKSEGLSDAQRDCIVAAKSLTERSFLMCPALVAKPPTWIIAPIGHPELLDVTNGPADQRPDVPDDNPIDKAEPKP